MSFIICLPNYNICHHIVYHIIYINHTCLFVDIEKSQYISCFTKFSLKLFLATFHFKIVVEYKICSLLKNVIFYKHITNTQI